MKLGALRQHGYRHRHANAAAEIGRNVDQGRRLIGLSGGRSLYGRS